MIAAILADIHGNLAAFEAVLDDIERVGGCDELWCLGDIVGYGPEPSDCIALLRRHSHLCVAGNHDWGAIGRIDISDFNPHAAAACRWTGEQLSDGDIAYLDNLPLTLVRGDFTIVHASPRDPIWEYVLSAHTAGENFAHFDTGYCLIGHSHAPAVFHLCEGNCRQLELHPTLELGGERLLINPGSVGQPRDGDPRAAYAVYDTNESRISHYRVTYDVERTQRRMMEAGLPQFLIQRLSDGW